MTARAASSTSPGSSASPGSSTSAGSDTSERIAPVAPGMKRFLLRMLAFWSRYFRYEVHGLEHVPATGPCLICTPHSCMTLDGFLLSGAIHKRYGRLSRGLVGLSFNRKSAHRQPI